jgi:D-inositol-3-phosphate glycosyltransferase
MSKKILLISPAHPLRGGIATSSERLALEFQQQGHEVEILSFALQYPDFLFPGTSQYTDEPAPKYLTIHTKLNTVNPLNWLKIGWQYRKKQYDLIVVRFWLPFLSPCLGTVLRFLPKKTPIVAITDNILPHEQRFGDTLLIRYFLSACDVIMTMSKSVMIDAQRFAPTKPCRYHPHPIYDNYGDLISQNIAQEKLQLDSNYKYLLFFGFIRAYKGLDLLLEALASPTLKKHNLKLIIAGEFYEDAEKYETIIRKHDLEKQLVRATHFIPTDEVGLYFSAADLIVQPYRSATQSGVSQVAYHFEKPIVVTNVGGLSEIIAHNKVGYVVAVETEAIAAAIADFFDNQRNDKFIANLKIEKKQFQWKSMVEMLLTVCKSKR